MITIRCLVDNTALRGSALWGEHGVAFSIETPEGQLLLDTGQSGDVLLHNVHEMAIDLGSYAALALSHAHYDHTGGLAGFFRLSRAGIPLYASPDLFRERYAIRTGHTESIGLRLSRTEIEQCARLCLSEDPQEIFPSVWTTGEISPRLGFEGRSPQHFIRDGDAWLPDPYRDDLSLVVQASHGLVVVCGCCHAGLLNTLAQVRRNFPQPIQAIIGGTHLAAAGPECLNHVVNELRSLLPEGTPYLYLNHCTGEHAQIELAKAFGSRVKPCPTGSVLMFD